MSQNNMPNSRPLRARVGLRCRESAHAGTDVAPGCARCCRSAFCTPVQTGDWRRKKKEKKMRAFGLRSRRLYKNKPQNDQNLGGRQPRAVLPRRFRTNLTFTIQPISLDLFYGSFVWNFVWNSFCQYRLYRDIYDLYPPALLHQSSEWRQYLEMAPSLDVSSGVRLASLNRYNKPYNMIGHYFISCIPTVGSLQ